MSNKDYKTEKEAGRMTMVLTGTNENPLVKVMKKKFSEDDGEEIDSVEVVRHDADSIQTEIIRLTAELKNAKDIKADLIEAEKARPAPEEVAEE